MRRVLRHRHSRRRYEDRPRDRGQHRIGHHGRQETHAPHRSQTGRRRSGHRTAGRTCRGIRIARSGDRCRRSQADALRPNTQGRGGHSHGRERRGHIVHGPLRRSRNRPEHPLRRLRCRHGDRALVHPSRAVRGRDGPGLGEGREGASPRLGRGIRAALHRRRRQAGQAVRGGGRIPHNRDRERHGRAPPHRGR